MLFMVSLILTVRFYVVTGGEAQDVMFMKVHGREDVGIPKLHFMACTLFLDTRRTTKKLNSTTDKHG